MKKWLSLVLALAVALVLAACGTSEEGGNAGEGGDSKESKKITVGASNVPHAEILDEAKPLLEEKGFELDVVKFQDYVLPNQAFFQ